MKGIEWFRLDPESDGEAVGGLGGHRKPGRRTVVATTHPYRHAPCVSLLHSSSFQEGVLEVLMNSLLIPLSGKSSCSGRAGGSLCRTEAMLLWSSQQLP